MVGHLTQCRSWGQETRNRHSVSCSELVQNLGIVPQLQRGRVMQGIRKQGAHAQPFAGPGHQTRLEASAGAVLLGKLLHCLPRSENRKKSCLMLTASCLLSHSHADHARPKGLWPGSAEHKDLPLFAHLLGASVVGGRRCLLLWKSPLLTSTYL